MRGQNCFSYIKLGLTIRFLMNIDGSYEKKFVTGELLPFMESAKKENFAVTLASTREKKFTSIISELEEIEDENQNIGADLAKKINDEFRLIEHVVFAESMTKKIYVLPSRRFNTDYLLDRPDKFLSEGSYEKLNEIARYDINSACRCLLFGEATASAFHILRATEAVLKTYYYHHRKKNRLNKPMWANMVDQLKAKQKNKPPESLLESLDVIRDAYRNPIHHPEAIYDIDRAQDLFGVCMDAIGQMLREI